MHAVWFSSVEESVATMTFFRYGVAGQMLQGFTIYGPKRMNGSYVHGIILSISRLASWVETMLSCL